MFIYTLRHIDPQTFICQLIKLTASTAQEEKRLAVDDAHNVDVVILTPESVDSVS